MDHRPADPDALALEDWEHAAGRAAGRRLCRVATVRLAAGEWDADDLEDAIEAAERRCTRRQLPLVWAALTSDPGLSALAAGA